MKYLTIVLLLLIAGCGSTTQIPVESDVYSTIYDKSGGKVKHVKLITMILVNKDQGKGLALKTLRQGGMAYHAEFVVWPENIDKFAKILIDFQKGKIINTSDDFGVYKVEKVNDKALLVIESRGGFIVIDKTSANNLLSLINDM